MSLYKETSLQIQQIFRRYTDLIEPLSLDEAYLDVTNNTQHQGSATITAREIRQAIKSELDLTASAGVAPVKFLAKIASDINKPDNQFTISPEEVSDFVLDLPLTKIPGVGKVTALKLESMGLLTCRDVQQYDLGLLMKRFGKFGYILYQRSYGIDERKVYQGKRKSVAVERTLPQNINDWDSCLNILETLYPELVLRLSKVSPNLLISKQGVKYKFDDFQATTQEHVAQIIDKESLFAIAHDAWLQRRQNRGVRLIGLQVSLQDEQDKNTGQFELALF
jgi:DNA polymerase-4